MTTTITKLHTTYCQLTGLQVRQMNWEADWLAFVQAGYGEQDLRDVLQWLLKENRKNSYQWSIRIAAILDLKNFDQHLAQARLRKPPVRSEGQKVVDNFRGFKAELPQKPAVSLGDVLRKAINTN